jgi:hypothetical protein
MVVGGIGLVAASLIYLNRHLMNAFASVDSGDLAGLARPVRHSTAAAPADAQPVNGRDTVTPNAV